MELLKFVKKIIVCIIYEKIAANLKSKGKISAYGCNNHR